MIMRVDFLAYLTNKKNAHRCGENGHNNLKITCAAMIAFKNCTLFKGYWLFMVYENFKKRAGMLNY